MQLAAATTENLRAELRQAVARLSREQLVEVMRFIEYLRYRDQVQRDGRKIVAREGLWKDVPFDITHDDVRALRRQVTRRTTQKAE